MRKKVSEGNYFLVVGRFVPENNYEVMIREFMKSNTKKTSYLLLMSKKINFTENYPVRLDLIGIRVSSL